MASEDIKQRAEKEIKYMFETIDSINIDNIQTEGVTLRAGNKVLKLQVVGENPLSIEDEIREEFRKKINTQLTSIKDIINDKISEMSLFVSNIKSEFDRQSRELKDKMQRSRPMPDILYEHAKQGLSIAKGNERDSIVWFVTGIYSPKTLDRKIIDSKLVKKLITPIVIQIMTKGENVTRVSTHTPIKLEHFQHYHQNNPDCWGQWTYPRSWKKPEDIIRIAREAEAVLENINSDSIARYNPPGLPRFETIKRHIIDIADTPAAITRKDLRRAGITEDIRSDEDMWST